MQKWFAHSFAHAIVAGTALYFKTAWVRDLIEKSMLFYLNGIFGMYKKRFYPQYFYKNPYLNSEKFVTQCDNLLPSAKKLYKKINLDKKNNNRKCLKVFLIPFSLTQELQLTEKRQFYSFEQQLLTLKSKM